MKWYWKLTGPQWNLITSWKSSLVLACKATACCFSLSVLSKLLSECCHKYTCLLSFLAVTHRASACHSSLIYWLLRLSLAFPSTTKSVSKMCCFRILHKSKVRLKSFEWAWKLCWFKGSCLRTGVYYLLIEWCRFVVCLSRVRSAASHVRSLMGSGFCLQCPELGWGSSVAGVTEDLGVLKLSRALLGQMCKMLNWSRHWGLL